jgi:hypothetical protein
LLQLDLSNLHLSSAVEANHDHSRPSGYQTKAKPDLTMHTLTRRLPFLVVDSTTLVRRTLAQRRLGDAAKLLNR